MPMRPLGFSACARLRRNVTRSSDLRVDVDDQHRVERPGRQVRIAAVRQPRLDVLQPFAADAAPDRLEHLALDVLRVDEAVRSDTPRESDREPAGAGADVGDRRAVGDRAARP